MAQSDGCHYAHHMYDPNLSSAARYSPSAYTTDTSGNSIHHHHQQQDYSNVTAYGNVILGVYTEDPSHAYILSSTESRLFNTYVRANNNEIDPPANNYGDHLIASTDMTGHHHAHTDTAAAHAQMTAVNGYEYVMPEQIDQQQQQQQTVTQHGVTTDEIIVQASDGQFYRQIQNVYVNGDDPGAATQVEFFPMIADYLAEHEAVSDHDDQQQHFYQHYEMNGDFEQQQQQCTVDEQQANQHQQHMNEVIVVPNSMELAVSDDGHQYYKNEYTVLEPMNRQMIQQHSEQQSSHRMVEQPSGIRPVAITMEEKEHQRLLLETTMSPLCKSGGTKQIHFCRFVVFLNKPFHAVAAVNDITARDEQLQQYLAQHQSDINGGYLSEHPAYGVATSTTTASSSSIVERGPPIETNAADYTCTTNSLVPFASSATNSKLANLQTVPNEYVDINEFVENRSHHYNGMMMDCDRSQENMLQRRSQRKIQKTNELLVSDKHVPCRAWATLPTSYLSIGKSLDNPTGECKAFVF